MQDLKRELKDYGFWYDAERRAYRRHDLLEPETGSVYGPGADYLGDEAVLLESTIARMNHRSILELIHKLGRKKEDVAETDPEA